MKATWVYVLSVCFAFCAAAVEDYSTFGASEGVRSYEESHAVQTYTRRCGIVPRVSIFPGSKRSDTEFGQYPWQVAILNGYEQDSFVCSGALISASDVLTSATCVKSLPDSYIRVRLGEYDIATDRNPKEAYANLELGVVKKTIHPGYLPGADYTPAAYDVAILRLEYQVDFSSYPQISPVCLPTEAIDLEYAECYVAGWSESELGDYKVTQFVSRFWDVDFLNTRRDSYTTPHYGSSEHPNYYKPDYNLIASVTYNLTKVPLITDIKSRTLDEAQVKLEEKYECQEILHTKLTSDQLCMSGVNGYDVCKADLGSPVACIIPDPSHYEYRYRRDAYSSYKRSFTAGPASPSDQLNARMVVVGVTSLVHPCNYQKATPAVVTEVGKSLAFILKNIKHPDNYDN